MVNKNVLHAISSSIHETNAVKTTWLSSFIALTEVVREESADIPTMPHDELVTAQREDPTIAHILHFLQFGGRPTFRDKQEKSLSDDSSRTNGINCS